MATTHPQPPFLGTHRAASIAASNAAIAAGSMFYSPGSSVIRAEDGAVMTLRGVGLGAAFQDAAAASALWSLVAFASSVAFTGALCMTPQVVSGVIAFTPNMAGAAAGASNYVRLRADGANVPTFAGFTEHGSSSGYDNRANFPNWVSFWFDGSTYWYSIQQAASPVADSASPAPAPAPAPSTSYARLVSRSADITESGSADPYTYTGTGTNYGSGAKGGIASVGLQSGADGSLSLTFTGYNNTSSMEPALMTLPGSALVDYQGAQCFFYARKTGNAYAAFSAGGTLQTPANTVVPADGDVMRLRRAGTSIIAEVSKNGGSTYTTIYTWTAQGTAATKFQISIGSAPGTVTNLVQVGLA